MWRWRAIVAGVIGLLVLSGCIQGPKSIDVRVGSGGERVDSGSVPDPKTLEEARAELRKAYTYIRSLEDEVVELDGDKDALEHEVDRLEERLERYEDD